MKAPISRVLPTPVASAKQSDGNSRSKSVTDGNSLRMAARAAWTSAPFFGRRDLRDAVQDLQRPALRRAQAQPAGDGVDVTVHVRFLRVLERVLALAALSIFTPEFSLKFRLGGQVQLVAAGEDRLLLVRPEGVADHGVVLVRAQDQPERRIVAFRPALAVVVVHVQLELPQVLMRQLAGLQIDDHEALQDRVVEDQIDVEVVAVQREPFLPGHEGEALAQFQQKGLQVVDQRLLQIRLDQPRGLRQAQKLHDHRVLEDIGGLLDLLALRGQPHQALLVPAQGQPLVQQAVDLPLQFAGRPVVLDGLDLVERAGLGLVHAEQRPIVGPGEIRDADRRAARIRYAVRGQLAAVRLRESVDLDFRRTACRIFDQVRQISGRQHWSAARFATQLRGEFSSRGYSR